MALTQLIPALGTSIFVHFSNDLVHFLAAQNSPSPSSFQAWAFSACIAAQYIEFFYYRGRGCAHLAGNCRRNNNKNSPPPPGSHPTIPITPDRKKFLKNLFYILRGGNKYAKVLDGAVDPPPSALENSIRTGNPNIKVTDNQSIATGSMDLTSLEEGSSVASDSVASIGKEEKVEEELSHWICLVCGKENLCPRHPTIISDLIFSSRGKFYKQTVVTIKPRRDMPSCTKCFTYMDYLPNQATQQLFARHSAPHQVFQNYPLVPKIQNGLKNDGRSVLYGQVKSFFFGLSDSPSSALMFNDWRVRKFVNNMFPGVKIFYAFKCMY
jgi:hypothetical protein